MSVCVGGGGGGRDMGMVELQLSFVIVVLHLLSNELFVFSTPI